MKTLALLGVLGLGLIVGAGCSKDAASPPPDAAAAANASKSVKDNSNAKAAMVNSKAADPSTIIGSKSK